MRNKAGSWFGEKVKSDGFTFDSKKEEAFYQRFIKDSGYDFDVHKSFKLHPIIELCNGLVRIRGSHYSPDFVLYDANGVIKHVVDVKNSFTSFAIDAAASLRFKLFALQYEIPVEVVVPRTHDFKVKIMGTTKKMEPVVRADFDYAVEELFE